VVERLATARGRRDRDYELVLDRFLPDEVAQPAGTERSIELILGKLLGRRDAGGAPA